MDSDDVTRLNNANTTLEQAIEAALAEVPGTLDDVELDTEDGVDIWVSPEAESFDQSLPVNDFDDLWNSSQSTLDVCILL